MPFEDGICFLITFYAFIHGKYEIDLGGEIWKLGRLQSDNEVGNRRIRESACTVIAKLV